MSTATRVSSAKFVRIFQDRLEQLDLSNKVVVEGEGYVSIEDETVFDPDFPDDWQNIQTLASILELGVQDVEERLERAGLLCA